MSITESLHSWRTLNEALRSCDEATAGSMLSAERKGKARLQFMLRIHGAYSKRRYERERQELAACTKAA